MANHWEMMLDSEDLAQDEVNTSSFGTEDYDERHTNDESESEYFEFICSTRKLPSAQWGLDSFRDPAQVPERD